VSDASRGESRWALAVHGGAGAVTESGLSPERERAVRGALQAVLAAGAQILGAGGTSLDAVEDAVRRLEDSPYFNAGRGAVFNARAEHELEASIMDGGTLAAGAVAVLRSIKNPVTLARRVMERSPHVFLQGEGAAAFAASEGIASVVPDYFGTAERYAALEAARARAASGRPPAPEAGTVGAVALDRHGNLAAATSTGGMTNKAPGRIGDSSIIGAGTYASNASCAVSGTGHGEYFIRATVARDVAALMEYAGRDVRSAAETVIGERLAGIGGRGGVIAVDRRAEVVFVFNTELMHRGSVTDASAPSVAVF
jgi:beta-aspartyl-peptidase (threonine type)